jgi:hypothetical protein
MFLTLQKLTVWINTIVDGVPQLTATLSHLPPKNKLRTLSLLFWVNPLYHAEPIIQFGEAITGLEALERVEICSTPWLVA